LFFQKTGFEPGSAISVAVAVSTAPHRQGKGQRASDYVRNGGSIQESFFHEQRGYKKLELPERY
jgi:hypothetical protein